MSPTQKREKTQRVQKTLSVSQRRACKTLGFTRSSLRYARKERHDEPKIRQRILELVRAHPRYGYRRITTKLQQEGYRVNVKRIYRIWLDEGLKVPRKARKKRSLGHGGNACHVRRAAQMNDVWCWDFIYDRTVHGQSLKWFSLVDEYTPGLTHQNANRSAYAWGLPKKMLAAKDIRN